MSKENLAEESDLVLQGVYEGVCKRLAKSSYKAEVESFVPRAMRPAAYLRW